MNVIHMTHVNAKSAKSTNEERDRESYKSRLRVPFSTSRITAKAIPIEIDVEKR